VGIEDSLLIAEICSGENEPSKLRPAPTEIYSQSGADHAEDEGGHQPDLAPDPPAKNAGTDYHHAYYNTSHKLNFRTIKQKT
jgi:hypothetical protein